MNAKEELLDFLEELGKTLDDIEALVIKIHTLDDNFNKEIIVIGSLKSLDKIDVYYDNGYGTQNLYGIVLFKDSSWLERWEYDGSEGWDYKKTPKKEFIQKMFEEWSEED